MAKLTERQAAFARNLVKGMSATEAARQAGYSESYANREAAKLVVKPQVAEYLSELRSKIETESIMSAQEVLERLTAIARGEGKVLRSTPTGLFELPPDWADRHKALAELAKHHGLLTDRVDLTSGGQPLKAYIGFDPEEV